MAYHLIKSGMQDCIIAGGAQEINHFAMASFDGLGVFATNNDQPTKASRPFDKDRNGLIPSGGGATVILESYESAIKRGAPILGEVIGYGFSSNGEHISTPNAEGDGAVLAMEKALNVAGLQPESIDYVNAHGTATPNNDLSEGRALLRIFGDKVPEFSSTKAFTGHTLAAAGGIEAVFSVLALQNNIIYPNLNFKTPMNEFNLLPELKLKHKELKTVLSNSFGFGGNCSTLIFSKEA
ncbi:UNVERIFIED_CONTAM: hypothetical protein GTU68_059156 [Idotea baltica]|nr:hypothetical protein [Idotea baltica]